MLGHRTLRNTPTSVKITPVFGLRDGMTRAEVGISDASDWTGSVCIAVDGRNLRVAE
jgi:hypothetical protein